MLEKDWKGRDVEERKEYEPGDVFQVLLCVFEYSGQWRCAAPTSFWSALGQFAAWVPEHPPSQGAEAASSCQDFLACSPTTSPITGYWVMKHWWICFPSLFIKHSCPLVFRPSDVRADGTWAPPFPSLLCWVKARCICLLLLNYFQAVNTVLSAFCSVCTRELCCLSTPNCCFLRSKTLLHAGRNKPLGLALAFCHHAKNDIHNSRKHKCLGNAV